METHGDGCEGIMVVHYDTNHNSRLPHAINIEGVKVESRDGNPIDIGSVSLAGKTIEMGEGKNEAWFHVDPSPHYREEGEGVYDLSFRESNKRTVSLQDGARDADDFVLIDALELTIDWPDHDSVSKETIMQEVSSGSRILFQYIPPTVDHYIHPLNVNLKINVLYKQA
jgi:hypothetical protein